MKRSAFVAAVLAAVLASPAVLIAATAHAQNATVWTPNLAAPATPGVPDQSLQRYVPQHFKPDGTYVPPHYEARQPPPFQGYFADKMAARERQKQLGYQEPAPAYMPPPDDAQRTIEGR